MNRSFIFRKDKKLLNNEIFFFFFYRDKKIKVDLENLFIGFEFHNFQLRVILTYFYA